MLRQRTLRDRLVALAAPPVAVTAGVALALMAIAESPDGRALGFLALAIAMVLATWSAAVGRSLLDDIGEMADASTKLAETQAAGGDETSGDENLTLLDDSAPGELGRLAQSINAVSQSSLEASENQRRRVRQGLSTIVVNLARRNQTLLDRQVQYLDEMERNEEDPDRLAELFRIDHLATRMRRNAESLLVLANADPGRRRGAAVPLNDVLRVAIGEVEHYQNIELGRVDEAELNAGLAVDVAHMAAELMENATQFSPPSAPVLVEANLDRARAQYVISIVDRGVGLGERIDQANTTLANPPDLGLNMGRSLGFIVVGRLAKRHGIAVGLTANGPGGTIAEILIPLALLATDEAPVVAGMDSEHQATATSPPAAPAPLAPAPASPAPAPNPDPGVAPGVGIGAIPAPGQAPEADPAIVPPATTPTAPANPSHGAEPTGTPHDRPVSTSLQKLLGLAPQQPTEPEPPANPDPEPARGAPAIDAVFNEADLGGTPPLAPDTVVAPLGSEWEPHQPPPAYPDPPAPSEAAPSVLPEPAPWPVPIEPTEPVGPPAQLREAVPSGSAFEQGVASLLEPEQAGQPGPPTEEGSEPEPPGGLRRRERGASNVPIGEGRPVAAPRRTPDEVRSMLSRYRDGLRHGATEANTGDKPDQPGNPAIEDWPTSGPKGSPSE